MLKNKIVIIVIFIVLAGAIAYNIHFFYKRTHPGTPKILVSKPSTSPSTMQPPPVAIPSTPTASVVGKEEKPYIKKEVLSLPRHKRILKTKSWGRNPFFSPDELRQIALLKGETSESAKKKKAKQIPVVLSGIIEVEHERMAIINNHVMLEGEAIGDIKLLKVMPEAVWVTVDNVRRWVPLPQSQLALVVQQNTLPAPHDLKTKEKEK